MADRVLFTLLGIASAVVVGVGLYWPQGLGAQSPAPFGHPLAAEHQSGGDSTPTLDMTSGLTGPVPQSPGR